MKIILLAGNGIIGDDIMDEMLLICLIPAFILVVAIIWQVYVDETKTTLSYNETKEYFEFIKPIIEKYKNQLSLERLKSRFVDQYGVVSYDQWQYKNGIDYFIHRVLFNIKKPPQKVLESPSLHWTDFYSILHKMIDETALKNENNVKINFDENMDGISFELFCEKLLKNNNWETTLTKKTGDQGVDIIAIKYSTKVAIQCKKYSQPVGNKAVQEVIAGQKYYQTKYAVVVTNTTFTESSIQLANTAGVRLLHYNDLNYLDEILQLNQGKGLL
jgi:HJR/Mrr/RecB family endonuclease